MEGVAIDEANDYLYLAISSIETGMTDGEGDVNVTENKCGIVYQAALDADFNISNLKLLIIGAEYNPDAANRCDVSGMANPDAVHVDPIGRVWIGEDTGKHENNVLWMFDPADGSLKRLATVPVGAEVTGLKIEEYPDESADGWASGSHSGAMDSYLGHTANAYDYGYIVELIPAEGVGTNIIKHYAMGRFSIEQAQVMPDGRLPTMATTARTASCTNSWLKKSVTWATARSTPPK